MTALAALALRAAMDPAPLAATRIALRADLVVPVAVARVAMATVHSVLLVPVVIAAISAVMTAARAASSRIAARPSSRSLTSTSP